MEVESIPPVTANYEQACMKCSKDRTGEVALSRCTGCKRVLYCSPACQRSDWARHKSICKALRALTEEGKTYIPPYPQINDFNLEKLSRLATQTAHHEVQAVQLILRRAVGMAEQNLITYQPRCIGCTQTDRHLRLLQPPSSLSPCPHCKMVFFCCDEHWEAQRDTHLNRPDKDGHDGLTQCQLNQEIRMDIVLRNAEADESGLTWCPRRIMGSWRSVAGDTSWLPEYTEVFQSEWGAHGITMNAADPMGPFKPLLRRSTEELSFPMTILWGLENLYVDDAWTKKKTLTIHIIGAYQAEFRVGPVFEEIMHRVPEVDTLELVFCGPELGPLLGPRSRGAIPMEVCPNCQRAHRKRIYQYIPEFYHQLKLGKPDLAIAFNSGLSQESQETWPATIKYLVDSKTPSLFTAYNRDEAIGDRKIIASQGAKFIDEAAQKNPWGCISLKIEPARVSGFYSMNGWIAGAFK